MALPVTLPDVADQTKDIKNAGNIDQLCINTIRTLAMDAVQQANSGHPGTPMALAPVAYVLWQRFLRYDPEDPIWPNRDRFVLSNGHASMLLYGLLHLAGVKAVNPAGLRVRRDRQGDQGRDRPRAHRPQVAQVHRERLPAHVLGRKAPQVEVHSLDHRIRWRRLLGRTYDSS